MAATTPRFDDKKITRSSPAAVILPQQLHTPFGRRYCVRPRRNILGDDGRVWTHRTRKTQTICNACAWLRPPKDFAEYSRTPVHWLAEEVRAVALTKCIECRGRHLQWALPNNCTGCIRATLDTEAKYLPAFPILEAPRPLKPPQPRDVPWLIPAGAE